MFILCNSCYSLRPILLKLHRWFNDGLKIRMFFFRILKLYFVTVLHFQLRLFSRPNATEVFSRPNATEVCREHMHLVLVTRLTVLG